MRPRSRPVRPSPGVDTWGMFERFNDRSRRVVVLAQEEARLLGHDYIGTEHLLLGLVHDRESVAAQALESVGVSLEAVRTRLRRSSVKASFGRADTSRSRGEPSRCSSGSFASPCSLATTTSAPSTSCLRSSGSERAWPRRCSKRSVRTSTTFARWRSHLRDKIPMAISAQ